MNPIQIPKQAVLDVLNSLEIIERQGGEDGYLIIQRSEENLKKMQAVGIPLEVIDNHSEGDTACILAIAFSQGYADYYVGGKLVVWAEIDDDLRYRVLNGQGTPSDAERLLCRYEPELYE